MTDDLTIDELWESYPIEIVGPNPDWQAIYERERDRIKDAFGPRAFRVNHIGSTAVPNLKARDIIDILIEVDQGEDMNFLAFLLVKIGYKKMHIEKNRISLNKGYRDDDSQEQIYHVHLRRPGDLDEIYFRNALRKSPRLAKSYESLKLRLAEDFKNDRGQYLLGKSEFINKYTAMEKNR